MKSNGIQLPNERAGGIVISCLGPAIKVPMDSSNPSSGRLLSPPPSNPACRWIGHLRLLCYLLLHVYNLGGHLH